MHFLTMCGESVVGSGICKDTAGVRPSGSDWFYAGVDPEGDSVPRLGPFSLHTYWPDMPCPPPRSEEHTSELQSQSNLVCRLLLEKKKKNTKRQSNNTNTE